MAKNCFFPVDFFNLFVTIELKLSVFTQGKICFKNSGIHREIRESSALPLIKSNFSVNSFQILIVTGVSISLLVAT